MVYEEKQESVKENGFKKKRKKHKTDESKVKHKKRKTSSCGDEEEEMVHHEIKKKKKKAKHRDQIIPENEDGDPNLLNDSEHDTRKRKTIKLEESKEIPIGSRDKQETEKLKKNKQKTCKTTSQEKTLSPQSPEEYREVVKVKSKRKKKKESEASEELYCTEQKREDIGEHFSVEENKADAKKKKKSKKQNLQGEGETKKIIPEPQEQSVEYMKKVESLDKKSHHKKKRKTADNDVGLKSEEEVEEEKEHKVKKKKKRSKKKLELHINNNETKTPDKLTQKKGKRKSGKQKVKVKVEEDLENYKDPDELIIISVKPGNTDEVIINKERRKALQEEIDRESCPVLEETESQPDLGQWETASFKNTEQRNKFVRLMGGFKKENSQPGNQRQPSTSHSKTALNQEHEEKLNLNLQSQFEKAHNRWMQPQQRGAGLGFQTAPNKKFHIDREVSRSIKFED
ncbi:lysine-rich nucleolar protein 1-like [Polypterus senegalus]